MSKSRFSTSDVQAMVRDTRSTIMGHRVANVYDLNDRTYLFKFNVVVPGSSSKVILLLESGTRFHTTRFSRDKNDMPSPFAMKLRKYIRTKRLEDIRQLSGDRVVDFKFGAGDSCNHIILEMYANGNIVLTDNNYEVLALLRSHQFDDEVALKVGEIYPLTFATEQEHQTMAEIPIWSSVDSFREWSLEKLQRQQLQQQQQPEAPKKSKQRKLNYKQLLLSKDSGVSWLGGEIIEHCLICAHLAPSRKVDSIVEDLAEDSFRRLKDSLGIGPELLHQLNTPGQPGYILTQPEKSSGKNGADGGQRESSSKVEYVEFTPMMFQQHEGKPFLSFPSFDEAVDEYYCKIEEQRLQRSVASAEEAAQKKVDKVRGEQQSLIRGLAKQQEEMQKAAMLVEAYAEDIDKVFLVLNSALSNGMSWQDIDDMVKAEKAARNPIASLVARLRLDKNHVVVQLEDLFRQDDEPDESDATTKKSGRSTAESSDSDSDHGVSKPGKEARQLIEVELDLAMSAFANARKMFDQRRTAQAKEKKTVEASEKAIAVVEEQAYKALQSQNLSSKLKSYRKMHWFEKFNWFITSEGYLVLSGRDAQQNDLLVKRYLRAGDAYVHADLNGASSCIVRCKTVPGADVPTHAISPLALQEAGCMTVCRSTAWQNKVVISAWWVHADQVSKTAPTGEYLTTGSFMIYGKKNFLPPANLEMGFGIVFRLADGSVSRHLNDRKDRAISGVDDMESVYSEAFDRYGIEFESVTKTAEDTNHEDEETQNQLEAVPEETEEAEEAEETKEAEETEEAEEPQDSNESAILGIETAINSPLASTQAPRAEDPVRDARNSTLKKKASPAIPKAPAADNISNNNSKSSESKKKFLNKKKAKRYAEQDDEDRELAMKALGHLKPGERKGAKEEAVKQSKEDSVRKAKQEKLGVSFQKQGWEESLATLQESPRRIIDEIVSTGKLRPGEIDAMEIKSLSLLSESDAVAVLELFCEGDKLAHIGNKSGFLAGILRRYVRDKKSNSTKAEAVNSAAEEVKDAVGEPEPLENTDETSGLSRRERKKLEQQEIQGILEEEGALDEAEGKQADEIEKLTAVPVKEDQLLYAVPMCGPYCSMQNFKFRVKLNPGTGKKGKLCKQAVELFANARNALPEEKALMKALTDQEMVAIMINDAKLSIPGLFQAKQAQQKKKKSVATRGSKNK